MRGRRQYIQHDFIIFTFIFAIPNATSTLFHFYLSETLNSLNLDWKNSFRYFFGTLFFTLLLTMNVLQCRVRGSGQPLVTHHKLLILLLLFCRLLRSLFTLLVLYMNLNLFSYRKKLIFNVGFISIKIIKLVFLSYFSFNTLFFSFGV